MFVCVYIYKKGKQKFCYLIAPRNFRRIKPRLMSTKLAMLENPENSSINIKKTWGYDKIILKFFYLADLVFLSHFFGLFYFDHWLRMVFSSRIILTSAGPVTSEVFTVKLFIFEICIEISTFRIFVRPNWQFFFIILRKEKLMELPGWYSLDSRQFYRSLSFSIKIILQSTQLSK